MKKEELKKLIKKLPKTPGVMSRDRYFNSAVLIPIVRVNKNYYLIFQKRAAHIRQGGDICFPGGGVEKEDKNSKQTAIRETYEELGIKKEDIKILGQLDTYVAPIGAVIEPFVAKIKKRALDTMVIDKNEVEEVKLIPFEFFKNNPPQEYNLKYEIHPHIFDEEGNKEILFPVEELGLPETYQKPWGHRRHKVWAYNYKGDIIWGLTAVIINDLIKKF